MQYLSFYAWLISFNTFRLLIMHMTSSRAMSSHLVPHCVYCDYCCGQHGWLLEKDMSTFLR